MTDGSMLKTNIAIGSLIMSDSSFDIRTVQTDTHHIRFATVQKKTAFYEDVWPIMLLFNFWKHLSRIAIELNSYRSQTLMSRHLMDKYCPCLAHKYQVNHFREKKKCKSSVVVANSPLLLGHSHDS